jgi:Zn-dependent protease
METIIFTVIVLIVSVILHEIAHGWAANALGDPTAKLQGRLSLNPVRHVDPVGSILIPAVLVLTNSSFLFGWAKPVPYNPYNLKKIGTGAAWNEAIVGIAGVVVNFLIAGIFALLARAAFANGLETFAGLASIIVIVNLSLGIFNLLPIPPLDGFTVLRGILPHKAAFALRDIENKIQSTGILGLVVILFLFSFFLAAPFGLLIREIFRLMVGV